MLGPSSFPRDVVIMGGAGHVGLPLALALASRGLTVTVYDINEMVVGQLNAAKMPFEEPGAGSILQDVTARGDLVATCDPASVATAETLIVVIGTPVDEHLNPDPRAISAALEPIKLYLRDGQLLVLRSTVYPGVTRMVEAIIAKLGRGIDVTFCPERIAEGRAMQELFTLPQIVAGRSPAGVERASALFGRLTDKIVELSPEEAELAKLFTNTWRYVMFATANQLYMMANDRELDFERIRSAVIEDYPRAANMPGAGLAAGPCLLKDTMQLAAFNNNNFFLGHSAMMVNEGLPLYLVSRLERRYDLSQMTVGILGMAFKAGSDDIRSSLSYKLRRILAFKAARVLCTDPYVTADPDLVPLAVVLQQADLLVVATPHQEYRDLKTAVPVADVWNLMGTGVRV